MPRTTEELAKALDALPEELRERAVAYLLEQAEKYVTLKQVIAEGLDDVQVGRTSEWNFEAFMKRAKP